MARPRFRRTPASSKSSKEPETKTQRPSEDSVEAKSKSSIDPNDPALLDEPALLAAPIEVAQDLDPATTLGESPVVGNDPALLDGVGGLVSRPDIGGLAEGEDLGVDPDALNPLGVGKPGIVLQGTQGSFNPADDLMGNVDSGRPGGASLDESSAGNVVGDTIRGWMNDAASSLTATNPNEMEQLDKAEGGVGKVSSTIEQGAALAASAADDADGGASDTPSQSGMPKLTGEQVTKLADDMAEVKETLAPDETQDINRHGKTFVVRGDAKADDSANDETKPETESEPAGATEDYVDGEDPLLGRADYQQEYQDMQIDAIRGSEVNPEGTEELYNDAEMPNFDDISGANDPTSMPEVETPGYLEGMVPDEGVIDPAD